MRIVAKNLSYTYNKGAKFAVNALKDVTLTIETGEFFGIIGHTGSGKSTFIQHLNALIPAQSGELFAGEFDLLKQKRKDKAKFKQLRKRIGMVFQYPEYQLFAETVFQDIAFGLMNFYPGLKKDEIEKRVAEAMRIVGLDYSALKDKSPFDLSGGQKRRVAIAGVIVSEPEVLVLDEPVAGLDPAGKTELWKLLHELNSKDRTIIVVSHDMNDVCEHCSKIAVFSDGTVISSGTAKEVFGSAAFLDDSKLAYPLTVYLEKELRSVGVKLDTGYSCDEFAKAVSELRKSL